MPRSPTRTAAARIERWPLDRIREAPDNPRTHTAQQVAQIAASLQEFGWTFPLLVDEAGELIAGHGRLAAARSLDYANAPVIVAHGWTDAQKRAYRIADNKLAMNAGWDDAALADELAALGDMGFPVDLLGFGNDEFAALMEQRELETALIADVSAKAAAPDKPHGHDDDSPEPSQYVCPHCGGLISRPRKNHRK